MNNISLMGWFRRALLALLSIEVIFLLCVIGAGLVFGVDANGGSYSKDSVRIAAFALFALALPALALAYVGRRALLAAVPLAAIASAICALPYIGFAFDLSTPTLLKLGIVIVLLMAFCVRFLARRST